MENLEINQQPENAVTVNDRIREYLLETSKWGKFLAIVGFVGIGLLMLLGLIVMIGFSVFRRFSGFGFPIGAVGFIYIIIGALYIIPVNYLYRFSDQVKKGFMSNDQESVTNGFESLKSLFKFFGIFTIVVLSLYAFLLIIILPLALFFR